MKGTLATFAPAVIKYLTVFANMLNDILQSEDTPKKDKKWLSKAIISILETQNVVEIAAAYNKVMSTYSAKDKKRIVALLKKYT